MTPDASAADAMSLASVLPAEQFRGGGGARQHLPGTCGPRGEDQGRRGWVAYMRSESVEILADVARDADRWGLPSTPPRCTATAPAVSV